MSEGRAGADLPELARSIFDLTGGNAFLVCELWRALTETNVIEVVGGQLRLVGSLAALGTPESVREVVNGRLARLASGTTELLELAATAGAEFKLAVVARAWGLAERELVAPLDEAIRSGMHRGAAGAPAVLQVRARARPTRRVRPSAGRAQGRTAPASGRSPGDVGGSIAADPRRSRLPLLRRRATRRDRASRSNTTSSRPRAAADSLAFDEAGAMLATALELGNRGCGAARRGAARAGHGQTQGGQGARGTGCADRCGADRTGARRSRAARARRDRL